MNDLHHESDEMGLVEESPSILNSPEYSPTLNDEKNVSNEKSIRKKLPKKQITVVTETVPKSEYALNSRNPQGGFNANKVSNQVHKFGIVDFNDLPADHFTLCYTVIEFDELRFLITDRPAKSNINSYVDDLLKHKVKQLIRVCESDYPTEQLTNNGITVTDLTFPDGHAPSKDIINDFLTKVKEQFAQYPGSMVAIHCVAGLGRAPVLVAIALMEAGLFYMDAVEFIRKKRRGAINLKQLDFLETYRPSLIFKPKKSQKNCIIM